MQLPFKFSDYQFPIPNSHYQFTNLRIATFISANDQPFDKLTVNCQLGTVNCQLPTPNCQLPTVNCQLSTVNCLFYQSTSALSSTTR
ncbi:MULTISPECIES: hypothetical protein [unclassified Microcoleus]|uniref:hypothetical protein n=1 Tax=unclassified Microcoleus TaxID=2642155 RepID=UPI0025F5EF8D|nr:MULTISPECIES: hypothetical protein [unclassified Microcoleus]